MNQFMDLSFFFFLKKSIYMLTWWVHALNGIAELQRASRFYLRAIHVKDCSPTWANAYKNQILKALKISP